MIGIFIGSFNPPTLAHVKICLKLSKCLKKIVMIPVNSKDKNLINLDDRINMLEILKKKYSFLEVDSIMKDYSYLNYHIIDLLSEKYNDIAIIIGSDLLDKLDSFENFKYLLNKYSFIVIERNNYNSNNIIRKKYCNYQNKFTLVDFNNSISSTLVRNLLKQCKNTSSVLDRDILAYIKKHDLY